MTARVKQVADLIKTYGPLTYYQAADLLGVTYRVTENAMRSAAHRGHLKLLRRGDSGHGIPAIYGLPDSEPLAEPVISYHSFTSIIQSALEEMQAFTCAELAKRVGIPNRRAADIIMYGRGKKMLERIGSMEGDKNRAVYATFGTTASMGAKPTAVPRSAPTHCRLGGYVGHGMPYRREPGNSVPRAIGAYCWDC